MKIEVIIDEAKILEIANKASVNELPQALFYEAKRQAIEIAVKEIKDKLVGQSYYGDKETLHTEVSNFLWSSIDAKIKELVVNKFKEKDIENIIARHFDKTLTEWLEKKIHTRLEEIKKDIFIGSMGEIDAEREAEARAHQDEIE